MKYALAHNLTISLLLLALAGSSLPVNAESGSASAWAEQFRRAEWVSRLRIEGIGSLINPSMSRTQLLAVQGYRYTASVVRVWKGEQAGTISFQVDLSDCPQLLDVDQEYIVFGSTNYRGNLQSHSCKDLVSVDDAGQLPMVLDQYAESRQVVGRSGS